MVMLGAGETYITASQPPSTSVAPTCDVKWAKPGEEHDGNGDVRGANEAS
jgi:hypothetical protein